MTEPGLAAGSDGGDAVLGRLADLAARALGYPLGVVVVFEERRSVRVNPLPVRRRTARAVAERVEQVRRTGQPLSVPDLSADGSGHGGLLPAAGAMVAAPLQGEDGVAGALVLVDTVPHGSSEAESGLLAGFARVATDQVGLLRRSGVWSSLADASTEARLREAIAGGEIVPYFQPVVDLAGGGVVAVEALARWPGRAGVGEDAAAFVADAERTSLIVDLDRAVARAALRALAEWLPAHPGLAVNVNVSGPSLDRPDLAGFLIEAAREAGVAPSSVRLELTETVRPSDPEAGGAAMEELRAAGFEVWYDDFGTGWSALADLLRYPVDGVKIDRSFAEELGTPADDAVIRAIATAAADLGLRVTIEGIETPDQARRARELGCDQGQGYLWSRPLPPAELTAWLAAQSP